MIEQLKNKIDKKKFVTGIIGLGYVGLPLTYSFLKNEMPVIGFDIDTSKIDNLKNSIYKINNVEVPFYFVNNHNDDDTLNLISNLSIDVVLNAGTPRKLSLPKSNTRYFQCYI